MNSPLVTIGIPVYNDEKWLARSLDNVIAQQYTNLEIIIADDCSVDRSGEICREYARRDNRIRFLQNKFNLGALKNHNMLFEISQGDYFAWGSGHDYFHPSFVSACVQVLQQDDSTVLCYPQAEYIAYDERPIRRTSELLEIRGTTPGARFKSLINAAVNPNMYYGLFRSRALAQSALHRKAMGGDLLFLAEMALLGGIAQIDEVLVYRKHNRLDETSEESTKRWIKNVIQPRGIGLEGITPWLDMASEYFKIIDAAPVSPEEKEAMLEAALDFCTKNFGGSITQDLRQLSRLTFPLEARYESSPNLLGFYAADILHRLNMATMFAPDSEETRRLHSFCESRLKQVGGAQISKARETTNVQTGFSASAQTGFEEAKRLTWGLSKTPFKVVYFEICGACNASCPYCITGAKGSDAPRGLVTVEAFTTVMNKLFAHGWIDRQSMVHLFTWGEPTLHPQLHEIISYVTAMGLKFGLSTNAYKRPFIDADFTRNLAQLIISMPGFSQASYDRVHGFDFNKVKENIEVLVQDVHRFNPLVDIQLNFHIYRFNTNEVSAGEEFARQLGIRFNPYYAYINNLHQFCGWVSGNLPAAEMDRINSELFTQLMRDGLYDGGRDIPAGYRCPQVDYLIIDEFANVATCCVLPRDHKDYSCGNILSDDMNSIMQKKISRAACASCVTSGLSRFAHAPKAYEAGRYYGS